MTQLGFRKPDSQFGQDWAVWYGKSGPSGDCATEVERHSGGFTVREFQNIAGLFDDFDPKTPILVTRIFVSENELEERRKEFDPIATAIEIAARVGVDRMANEGSDGEEFASALPQPGDDYQQQRELILTNR